MWSACQALRIAARSGQVRPVGDRDGDVPEQPLRRQVRLRRVDLPHEQSDQLEVGRVETLDDADHLPAGDDVRGSRIRQLPAALRRAEADRPVDEGLEREVERELVSVDRHRPAVASLGLEPPGPEGGAGCGLGISDGARLERRGERLDASAAADGGGGQRGDSEDDEQSEQGREAASAVAQRRHDGARDSVVRSDHVVLLPVAVGCVSRRG